MTEDDMSEAFKGPRKQSVTVPRIFSGTGTGTFFRDQFFPIPVPVPSKKEQNSRDRDVTLWSSGSLDYLFQLGFKRPSAAKALAGSSGDDQSR